MTIDGTESPRQEERDTTPAEGFSAFITRILDQLSLSSWLPAIMLVCNVAVILQLRGQSNFNLARAITSLAAKPLGILIVLTLSIIAASIVTQAFELELIRLLEGYWGPSRPLGALSTMLTRRHVRRLATLERQYQTYSRQAFNEARDEMLDRRVERDIVDILDKAQHGEPLDGHAPERVTAAEKLGWRRYVRPELLGRMDAVERLIQLYPNSHRIMPTQLGNTLRAGEDQLKLDSSEHLEEFVYRRYHLMGPELQTQHDQFRSRLNIYSLLTLIFSGLAITSPIALIHRRSELAGGIAFTAAYAALALLSYHAAIASARGYIRVLKVIDSRARTSEKT